MSDFGGFGGVVAGVCILLLALLGWGIWTTKEARNTEPLHLFLVLFFPATLHLGVVSWQLVGVLAGFTGERFLHSQQMSLEQWPAAAGQLAGFFLLGLAVGYAIFVPVRALMRRYVFEPSEPVDRDDRRGVRS